MNPQLWEKVYNRIIENQNILKSILKDGQFESLVKIAESLKVGGVILADEVGLGKTFVALALAENVILAGGTVGIIVPPGLLFQWEGEIKKFRNLLKENINGNIYEKNGEIQRLQYYRDFIQHDNDFPLVKSIGQKNRPLALISHNFNAPAVRYNTGEYAYRLPSLYYSCLDENKNKGSRDGKFWRTWLEREGENASGSKLCKYLVKSKFLLSKGEKNFLGDRSSRVIRYSTSDSRHDRIVPYYYRGEIGNQIFKKIIGHGIGELDLVIVDEAHKSKDSIETRSVLGTLLQEIINPVKKDHLRVLGMTATPVELDASQWSFLLERVGVKKEDVESKASVIRIFSEAISEAKKYPENRVILSQLMVESKKFEKNLEEIVTRRRRFETESFRALVGQERLRKSSHPNRKLAEVKISFSGLSPYWKESVFSFEGISKTAKGLDENRLIKLLDKRYAAGLINKEVVYENSEKESSLGQDEVAQRGRMSFWLNILNKKSKGDQIENEESYLNEHPRVQAGADHIDQITFRNGSLTNEKILVFGTYTKPLRALRNVINYRYILRQMDNGLPVRFSEDEESIKTLFEEYERLQMKENANLRLNGKLKNNLSYELFKSALFEARKNYEKLSQAINRFFKEYKNNKNEDEQFYDLLPGNDAIKKLPNIDSFYSFLQHYILSEILKDKELYSQYENDFSSKFENISSLARTIWEQFILAHSTHEEIQEARSKEDYCDFLGDKINHREIIKIIGEDEQLNNPSRSSFCRFMDGSTPEAVRKTLQQQFNSFESMPKVLIAQSMVGREGLNLHLSCRRVVLFHPEWNPAVVEQQIGRVDRINSLWEQEAKIAKENGEEIPFIEVDFLVFEGTYDQYQFERMKYRRENMNAQLFGALLPEETVENLADDMKEKLANAAPNFSPIKNVK